MLPLPPFTDEKTGAERLSLPKVTGLMSGKAGPWQVWLHHPKASGAEFGLSPALEVRGCHILFWGCPLIPTIIKEFQLISFIQPGGQRVPGMMKQPGIPKHRQKKLYPSSKGRDNFLYSQKNTCLAAETTKCVSPEARTPV